MKKAVRLRVTLWARGDDAPAHDFAASSIDAVRRLIEEAAGSLKDLSLSIEKIVEDDDYDSDEEETS